MDKFQFARTGDGGYIHCSFVLESKDEERLARINGFVENIKAELASIKSDPEQTA